MVQRQSNCFANAEQHTTMLCLLVVEHSNISYVESALPSLLLSLLSSPLTLLFRKRDCAVVQVTLCLLAW